MIERLVSNWWVTLIRGIVGVLFGAVALVWPGITVLVLVALFGAYALVNGIFSVVAAFARGREQQPWGLLAFEGAVGIIAGLVAILWPSITAVVLLLVVAVWALWTGILQIMAGVRIRKEVEGEWMLYLSGGASVLFGVLLLISPRTGAVALVWLIGIYALIFGGILIVLAIRLRGMRGKLPPPPMAPA